MANEASNAADVDKVKRRFLVGATSVVGGIGVIATATPFMMSMWPSERAKAAGVPVEVDVSKIEPGQKIDVEWRGKVVWLINRTQPMLDSLPKLDSRVADPEARSAFGHLRRARWTPVRGGVHLTALGRHVFAIGVAAVENRGVLFARHGDRPALGRAARIAIHYNGFEAQFATWPR